MCEARCWNRAATYLVWPLVTQVITITSKIRINPLTSHKQNRHTKASSWTKVDVHKEEYLRRELRLPLCWRAECARKKVTLLNDSEHQLHRWLFILWRKWQVARGPATKLAVKLVIRQGSFLDLSSALYAAKTQRSSNRVFGQFFEPNRRVSKCHQTFSASSLCLSNDELFYE